MRAGDYVYLLEQYGIPPSERDLHRLDVGSRAVAALRLPITAADLAFEEPPEPDRKKKRSLALAESIPPESRRRLVAAFNVYMTALDRMAKQLPAAKTEKSP